VLLDGRVRHDKPALSCLRCRRDTIATSWVTIRGTEPPIVRADDGQSRSEGHTEGHRVPKGNTREDKGDARGYARADVRGTRGTWPARVTTARPSP